MSRQWNGPNGPSTSSEDPWLQIPRIYANKDKQNGEVPNPHREPSYSYAQYNEAPQHVNPTVSPPKENKLNPLRLLQIAFAEFLGTGILMYVGCYGCDPLSFGLAVLAAAQIVGHISGGHFNPSVTIAAIIMQNISFIEVPVYLLGQLLGAFGGYGLLYYTAIFETTMSYCTTAISPRITIVQACGIEVIATMILVLLVCTFWDQHNANRGEATSIKVALTLIGLIAVTAKDTGASFNSIRTLIPSIFADEWQDQWVYWVAPNIGAVIGAVVYRFLLQNRSWQK